MSNTVAKRNANAGWLKELEEAEKAATKGPWYQDLHTSEVDLVGPIHAMIHHREGLESKHVDAQFIALSRNHMKDLLELVTQAAGFVIHVSEDMDPVCNRTLGKHWLAKYRAAIGEE